ncbi:MAG TPA: BTAD domain-containing putative transcriptional regulator, partial [Acidimicrobiales bacterium]|nr:BTAD domain-containing putative transcriptional regulator [Acidimicrobiales bacterium]
MSRCAVRVRVLGPLRAQAANGADVTPAGSLQRRLLALLVLRRGQVVAADVAADVLWPDRAPRDPSGALQNHLSRLRQALPADAIGSVGDGYRLDPAAVEVDADQLPDLLDAAAAGDAGAAGALAALLDGWQGPALPELADVDDGRAEAMRLDELRLRAREVLAEHRLARGDTDGLVAELMALTDAEPLRERPRELLMAVLARTGRRAEALRTYDDFRRTLGSELGIEPSPALAAQHAALLDGAPTPATPAPAAQPLPVPTTTLVGRDQLEARAADLVETTRLLTLVGPGGVGKTRLLLELGHVLRRRDQRRPVALCELAAADHRSAVNLVAAALGVDLRAGAPPAAQLATVLGDREVVLLVDNCEHVLEPGAELVAHLLTRCPGLRAVATSRERLRVPGEHVCVVPTLPTDGPDSPAVQLFLDRAEAVAAGFEPDADELEAIAEVVRRLDGLPLAIELAAARLFTHDVHEVRAGLDRRFALLTSGDRTSSRHGSLGAAISWSYGLLDEPLQRFFAALSSFTGPFDVDGAAAVADRDVAWASEALALLVERSLVLRTPDRRHALLESLRAFGADQLDAVGDVDLVGGRHARWAVAWAERAERRFLVSGEAVTAEIDAALPELHLALGWLLDHGDVEAAGRLVASLIDYGILRLRPDVLAWAERVAAADPGDRSPFASRVWVAAAYAAWMA